MGRRRCCCYVGCWADGDDFNRADTPVGSGWGSKWDSTNGVGNISSNRGKLDSGYMVFNQSLPDNEGSCLAKITVDSPQDDDVYEVHIAWKDATHYLGFRFEVDGSWWVQSLSSAGGSWFSDDVEVISGCGTYQDAFLAGREFAMSYDREVLRIGGTSFSSPHYEMWGCYDVTWSPSNKIVLAHGGGPRPIYFDSFWVSDHFVHDPTCPFYGCVCQA